MNELITQRSNNSSNDKLIIDSNKKSTFERKNNFNQIKF